MARGVLSFWRGDGELCALPLFADEQKNGADEERRADVPYFFASGEQKDGACSLLPGQADDEQHDDEQHDDEQHDDEQHDDEQADAADLQEGSPSLPGSEQQPGCHTNFHGKRALGPYSTQGGT